MMLVPHFKLYLIVNADLDVKHAVNKLIDSQSSVLVVINDYLINLNLGLNFKCLIKWNAKANKPTILSINYLVNCANQ